MIYNQNKDVLSSLFKLVQCYNTKSAHKELGLSDMKTHQC